MIDGPKCARQHPTRRQLGLFAALGLMTVSADRTSAAAPPVTAAGGAGFGQINRLVSKPGQQRALAAELHAVIAQLPTVIRYDVLTDPADPAAYWTIELWPSRQAHDAAVARPAVRAGIGRLRALVATFENVATFDIPTAAASGRN